MSDHIHTEMHEACKERFRDIEERLNDGDKIMTGHTTDIAVLKTNMSTLIKSLGGLTKALWGVSGTIVAALFGFFIWYIQNL